MWFYPVRSDEGVPLVTNELLANVNDLPEVVLIKVKIRKKDKQSQPINADSLHFVPIQTTFYGYLGNKIYNKGDITQFYLLVVRL